MQAIRLGLIHDGSISVYFEVIVMTTEQYRALFVISSAVFMMGLVAIPSLMLLIFS
jgi:hypothetical protein